MSDFFDKWLLIERHQKYCSKLSNFSRIPSCLSLKNSLGWMVKTFCHIFASQILSASENFLKISPLSFLIPGKNVYQWYIECDLFVIITGNLFD